MVSRQVSSLDVEHGLAIGAWYERDTALVCLAALISDAVAGATPGAGSPASPMLSTGFWIENLFLCDA